MSRKAKPALPKDDEQDLDVAPPLFGVEPGSEHEPEEDKDERDLPPLPPKDAVEFYSVPKLAKLLQISEGLVRWDAHKGRLKVHQAVRGAKLIITVRNADKYVRWRTGGLYTLSDLLKARG